MMRSLFSAVSGLKNHQTAQDVIANNIANVNTTAYKSSSTGFQDIVNQTISEASAPTATIGGINSKQVGLGMSVAGITKNMNEGSTQSTDRPLDFAIHGEGYFVVKKGTGTYYTRNGNLKLDNAGNLVTSDGAFVQGVTGTGTLTGTVGTLSNIQIDGKTYSDYAIDTNGYVTATERSSGNSKQLGRLVLGTFNNPAGLDSVGNNEYIPSNNSGTVVNHFVNENEAGTLQSGELEMSNVSLANELTNMIIVQRGFQANSRVITTSDSMLEELVNLKR